MPGVQNRVAIVSGAARGIGAATAGLLAREGAAVAVLDIDQSGAEATAAKIVAGGDRAIPVVADVSNADQVQAAVDSVADAFGSVDILVNNAGVLRDNLLFKMSEADWDTVMNVHLRGAFLCSKAAQAHMVASHYGRIINISSTAALGNRGQSNYSTAKAGLQGLAKTMAIELGPLGITCNVVGPGFVETEMTKATAERTGSTIDAWRERAAATLPVRRGGIPADIANAVWFLAREESGYITGQVLYVDGGRRL
jgi:3-oxoacyl-[acyl-carrier protein] reductase